MIIDIIFIVVGFWLLVKGGDFLVDGAVAIARRAKLSNMVIGLTVIGFGTSAPELLVSAQAALIGSSGIAIGNVVGSNIANIALILGLTAIIFPIPASRSTLRRDTPFMLLATLLLVAAGWYGTIDRLIGLGFITLIVVFVYWQIKGQRSKVKSQMSNVEGQRSGDDEMMPLWKALLMVVISIAALVIGANILIKGATGIALALGTSERIIGLTIVAVGTSLPELFATVMAARKHQTDMALGNIIGSVTFNILCVIGLSALICPIHQANLGFKTDYIVMLSLAVLLWIFLRTSHKLERWEGLVLLLIYILYLIKTII